MRLQQTSLQRRNLSQSKQMRIVQQTKRPPIEAAFWPEAGMAKRERFVTPVTCPECALNGSATWEERRDLETIIKGVSGGFRIDPDGGIYCADCGVKAIIGKTLSQSEMN
jgi:hypothetical protein